MHLRGRTWHQPVPAMLNLCVTSAYLGRPFTDWRRSRVALKMHTRALHENCSNHTFGWEQGTASAPSCGWSVKAEVQISVKSFWATFFICDALLGSFFLDNVSWGKFFFAKLVERGLSLWDGPSQIFRSVKILTRFKIIIHYLCSYLYSINHIWMVVNLPVDLWFMQQVNLILNQNHGYMSTFVLNFSFPFFDGLEGGMIGCRKRDHAGLCSPIISFSDSIKLFLASSVPKHESDIFSTCPKNKSILKSKKIDQK